VLYICIPAYNEAPTIGLLMWRIRKVFQGLPREYEFLVYNDASTDSTAETLAGYAEGLPLTVIGSDRRAGVGRATDALLRAAAERTLYPRRDAAIVIQGDFTDQPEHIPELLKRFEGGADLVLAERPADAALPAAERRLRRLAPWFVRRTVAVDGVTDPFSSFRLYRLSVVKDAARANGDRPLATEEGWGAQLQLLQATTPFARRVESVSLAPRYDVRPRATRIRPWADAWKLRRVLPAPTRRSGATERESREGAVS